MITYIFVIQKFISKKKIIRVFCSRAGPSLQAQDPRLHPHCKLRNQATFYQWLNMCSSFPLLSTSHFLFSIWTDVKRSEKIPGAPIWRWGEWIWLTGPSGLHQNSPQGLNISSIRVFNQIRDPEIPIILCTLEKVNTYLLKSWIKKYLH